MIATGRDVNKSRTLLGINGQLAKYRTGDVIREADVYRMTKSTRQARKSKRRTRISLVGTVAVLIASASPAAAAPGDLDPTFDGDGRVTTDFAGGDDRAWGIAIQGDGKIVAAGFDFSGDVDWALARYNTDGSLDSSFDGDGKVTTDFGGQAFSVAIQADGKIVAAGYTIHSWNYDFALARYNTDGSLDTTFDGDGKVTTDFAAGGPWPDDIAFGMAIQANGKIVAAGCADCSSGSVFALARYNLDGSLDATFDGDGKVTTDFAGEDQAFTMAIQADGRIVAAGTDGGDFALARYNTDGSLDTTFDGDGQVPTDFAGDFDQAFAVAIQASGKIVAAGTANYGTESADFAVARYNTDGSLDTTFSGAGKVTTDFAGGFDQAFGVAIQANGKIVAAGVVNYRTESADFALVRYNAHGSLDPTFSGDGKVTTDFAGRQDQAQWVAIQADGKIVAAGYADVSGDNDFALARYTACRRTSRPSSDPFCP